MLVSYPGSFGSCPRPVCEAFKALQDKAEEQPDVSHNISRFCLSLSESLDLY